MPPSAAIPLTPFGFFAAPFGMPSLDQGVFVAVGDLTPEA